MKNHAIIPIFIPHRGCPHDCVFCNQKIITARQGDVTAEDIHNTVEQYMSTLSQHRPKTLELAFFGGSFTGLPMDEQAAYLRVAADYKSSGLIDKIHLSTRPDYISKEILEHLAKHSVDVIELGVQSFDPAVLAASRRGHTAEDIYQACDLIKAYGFTLGIQLMIGLPGDSRASCLFSAKETARIRPDIARLYPTIVLEDTELARMYLRGEYVPLPQEEAVSITGDMFRIIAGAGTNIIRVGLKSTDLVQDGGRIRGKTYHPAFRQLVEGTIAREDLEAQIETLTTTNPLSPGDHLTFLCAPKSFSNMIGNCRYNKTYFASKYPGVSIRFGTDETIEEGRYLVVR